MISHSDFTKFLLGNTSVSYTTSVAGEDYSVFHFEGGDFMYEVVARHVSEEWDIHSVTTVGGEVK